MIDRILLPEIQLIKANNKIPVYQQIVSYWIDIIKKGLFKKGQKLPGTRLLSQWAKVHRNTMIIAIDELARLDYVHIIPNKGTFISYNKSLPIRDQTQDIIEDDINVATLPLISSFKFELNNLLSPESKPSDNTFAHILNEGIPDRSLVPTQLLSKEYSSLFKKEINIKYLDEQHAIANPLFLNTLTQWLNTSRNIQLTSQQVLTTRGDDMSLYLISQLFFKKDDVIIVGSPNHFIHNKIIQYTGARLLPIAIKENGIDLQKIKSIKKPIKAIVLQPFQHYPTASIMSLNNKIELLNWAYKNKVLVIEDTQGLLWQPLHNNAVTLQSLDTKGIVISFGSFNELLAANIQSGFITAPNNIIIALHQLRLIIDRQSDILLEHALHNLIKSGAIDRIIRKNKKVYNERAKKARIICQELTKVIPLEMRQDHYGIWIEFKENINLKQMADHAHTLGIYIPQNLLFQSKNLCAIRIGFASYKSEDFEQIIQKIKQAILLM